MLRTAGLLMSLLLAACSGEVYLRDGVTDGDTFYLADRALADPDPALQSWVSYSLTRSACQLAIGGDNPARASSFDCELTARRHLVETWTAQRESDPAADDAYLNDLTRVAGADFLPEYVARYFGRRTWRMPEDLRGEAFRRWQKTNLPRHRPETRLTGSWNYARNVTPLP